MKKILLFTLLISPIFTLWTMENNKKFSDILSLSNSIQKRNKYSYVVNLNEPKQIIENQDKVLIDAEEDIFLNPEISNLEEITKCLKNHVGNYDKIKRYKQGYAFKKTKDRLRKKLANNKISQGPHDTWLEDLENLISGKINKNNEQKSLNEMFSDACSANLPELATILLQKYNADINYSYLFGKSSLHFAVINGKMKFAQLLIKNGANINLQDDDGYTPLMFASMFGKMDIVKLLLDNGSDIYATNRYGRTVFDYTPENKYKLRFLLFKQKTITSLKRLLNF